MKIIKKLISLIIVMVSIVTFCCSNAFALSWSGSTNIESNSPTIATSGFSVPYTSENNLVGYRFSVVSSTGETKLTSDYLRGSNYYMTTYNKVLVSTSSGDVQNKYQLKSNYSAAYKTTTKTFTTYSSLPSVSSIESWVLTNADALLIKMGYSGGEDDLLYGDRLIVEPLFMIVIASEKLTMTISDIAIVGSQVFGKTGNVYSEGWSNGTWGFLANYTQKFFPNYLHTNSNSSLWSDLWSTAPTLSSIATFGTLLDCGYGVGVAFQNTTAKYTVTYNANGGTSGSVTSQTKTHGVSMTISSSATPSRTGYTFLGWSTSSSATSATYSSGGSYTTNASDILYAVWKANTYTVTYNANGGTSGSVTSQTKTYGVSMTISSSATPSRTGYSFAGWGTYSTDTTANYQSGGSYTSNSGTTLYAIWTPNTYTVTYNANGGTSGSITTQTKTYGVSMTISSNATPSRTGYSFAGWGTYASDTSANYQSGSSYTSNSGTTLYAIWTPNTYTVTYNANGGSSGSITSQTKTYGVSMTISSSATPSRTGYSFLGWSTSSTATSATYSSGGSYTTNASDILYAVWKINTYTITLNANGGTLGTTTSYTVDYGGTVSLWSSSWATRTGYTFLGYSTNPNATTAEFEKRYTTNSNIYTITSSDIWYAVWEANTDIYPEFIEPNSTYRSGTEIIASYNIFNDGISDFTPTNPIEVAFKATSTNASGVQTVILNTSEDVIVPSNSDNLVWFKVDIPSDSKTVTFALTTSSSTDESDMANNTSTETISVSSIINSQTDDTDFINTPTGFIVPSSSLSVPTMGQTLDNNASWSVWEWDNGSFVLKTYGIELDLEVTILPDSVVQSENTVGLISTIKSGYAIETEIKSVFSNYGTYTIPDDSQYTIVQNGNMYFPENQYSWSLNDYRTLELVGDSLKFNENENTITSFGILDYRRVHFTPVFYPDGDYTVKIYAYDAWTPAGMINTTTTNTQIYIFGNIFDDWVFINK